MKTVGPILLGIVIFIALSSLATFIGVRLWFESLERRYNDQVLPVCKNFPRDYQVGTPSMAGARLVILGDSTAFGAGATSLEATVPYQAAVEIARVGFHLDVHNRSVIGARIGDVVSSQWPEVKVSPPEFIILLIGANDSTHFTDFAAYNASLHTLLEEFSGLPHTHIFLATAPDMSLVPALPWGIDRIVNARIIKQDTQLLRSPLTPNIHIVDLYRDGKLDPRRNAAFYAADCFHPADAGYAIWARLFKNAIRMAVGRP